MLGFKNFKLYVSICCARSDLTVLDVDPRRVDSHSLQLFANCLASLVHSFVLEVRTENLRSRSQPDRSSYLYVQSRIFLKDFPNALDLWQSVGIGKPDWLVLYRI